MTEKKQVLTVAGDFGNAYVKVVRRHPDGHKEQCVFFPNMVAANSNNVLQGFNGFRSNDPLIVRTNEGSYAIGYSAEDISTRPRQHIGYARYDNEEFKVIVAAALGEIYPSKGGTVALTFSLPVDGFGRRRAQVESLAGRWSFECRGRKLNFELPRESMNVVPEAFGSVAFFLLSADGNVVNSDLVQDSKRRDQRIAVLDIGGFTTQTITFRALELAPVHRTVERGVIQVRDQVNRAIKTQYGRFDLGHRDLDDIIRTGEYVQSGEVHDVRDIIEEAVWELTQGVMQFWTDPNGLDGGLDYNTVIMTGGGSPLLRPYLERAMMDQGVMHHNILRVPDDWAHLANAIGAYRYTVFMQKNV